MMSFLTVKAGDGLLRSFCSHMGNVRHADFVDKGSSIRHSRQRRRDAGCLMFPGDILFKTNRFLGNRARNAGNTRNGHAIMSDESRHSVDLLYEPVCG